MSARVHGCVCVADFGQMDEQHETDGVEHGEARREHEMVFCQLDGISRLLYVA